MDEKTVESQLRDALKKQAEQVMIGPDILNRWAANLAEQVTVSKKESVKKSIFYRLKCFWKGETVVPWNLAAVSLGITVFLVALPFIALKFPLHIPESTKNIDSSYIQANQADSRLWTSAAMEKIKLPERKNGEI
jgi:hypothetical protein